MFSDAVHRRATALKRREQTLKEQVVAGGEQLAASERVMKRLDDQSGWRERNVYGLFGGDRSLAERLQRSRRQVRDLRSQLSNRESKQERLASKIDRLLEPQLLRIDPAYQRIATAGQTCQAAVNACTRMQREVRLARAALPRELRSKSRGSAESAKRLRVYIRHVTRISTRAGPLADRMQAARFEAREILRTDIGEAHLDSVLVARLPIDPDAVYSKQDFVRRVDTLDAMSSQLENMLRYSRRWSVRSKAMRGTALRAAHRWLG